VTTSELVTPQHLTRKAVVYVRQSSPHQVLSNQESLRLQYALQQRATDLGWRPQDIEVVDADLGMTAAAAEHREGFKDVLARVTLGLVGIILSIDVTRLSRNCSDWYPLLDLCGFKGCLIADRDGVYDPATPNGRLLLGLKGQISEVELYTIRSRLTSGRLNKAERGELALRLPVGLARDAAGVVCKAADQEVRGRIELVFSTFLRLRSAGQVVRYLTEHGLDLPRRDRFGDIVWHKPSVAAVVSMLKNPAYAGAFVYGRTRMRPSGSQRRPTTREFLPPEQWRVCVKDKYPAYITWETYEQIRARLADNYAEYDRNHTRGVPRAGAALLQGIVYCGECGHKMSVQYKPASRYQCAQLRQEYHVPVCQNIRADPVDAKVVEAFFEALSPVELDAYARAMASKNAADAAERKARAQRLERLRYEAELARRQYARVDPDNRLVASELERRWEEALHTLKQAEEAEHETARSRVVPFALSADLKEAFTRIGEQLPTVWASETLSREQRKGLLRCLIEKVAIRRKGRDRIETRIVWRGGEATVLEVPTTVGKLSDLVRGPEMEARILELARGGRSDDEIAEQLTSEGHRSPLRDRVIVSTVSGIRRKHRMLCEGRRSHPRQVPGYLTVPQIAKALGVSAHWVYDRINNGKIPAKKDPNTGLYLFPESPNALQRLRRLKGESLKRERK
jgi:DNA invertase Pin-like site-specific DNA recombinase